MGCILRKLSKCMSEGRKHLYIVRCVDGSLFTGVTDNPDTIVAEFNAGNGPTYTRSRCPVFLVYCEEYMNQRDAESRAEAIRGMSRGQKEDILAMANTAVLDAFAFSV